MDELVASLGSPAGARWLLDAGCGPGTVASAARRAGYRPVGVDAAPSMLRAAQRREPGLPWVAGALPRLPVASGTFDAVAANFVVNHTPDPRASLRELVRVARPGGRVALTIWTAAVSPMNQLWRDVLAAASVAAPPARTLPPELDFERTPSGLADLAAGAGLGDVVVREVQWEFRIGAEDLWRAVDGGIATIGQTYLGQPQQAQDRMRGAYRRLVQERYPQGELRLPSSALLGRGTVPPGGRV